jgi:starch synthase (maltosyl-transferring)
VTPALPPPRIVIQRVMPSVDEGRFAIKRTTGEEVEVVAHVFADGHDELAVVLQYRYAGTRAGAPDTDAAWQEEPLTAEGNDSWAGRFSVDRLGRYEFRVQAWIDRFGSWRTELSKKAQAGQDVTSELLDGAALVRQSGLTAATVEEPSAAGEHTALSLETALAPELAEAMRRADDRTGAVTSARIPVLVERERARYGAWYEMFPRSATPDPARGATLAEAAARLPAIAAMGFDVVYLPPIHPIGVSFRKGRNNAPAAQPGDPGSPWAIGSAEGGHKAVDPSLGTLEDFDRFVSAARDAGLEVALDLAYQCSPDHPYVTEHPEWFRHRPDGTIKYAENPPKKYQDIYPFDFESPAWRSLWDELKSIVTFWIDHGVTIFRVDNPHTKPFAFWEWLLAEVKGEHPETIFLSEAFTRPKPLGHLAKLGFSQSYTYFTWRNTKAELTEYFTELTATPIREYLRPNLFANTPDILHAYLQQGGCPAFQVRLVLAATLGASYGIYNGFELCENRAVPGTEEYLDSEKYQIRVWDWERPGHITPVVTAVNRIRREHAALQGDWSLRFHATDNDQIICYSKTSADETEILVVVVNLDPVHMQHGWVHLPVSDWGFGEDAAFEVHDLLSGDRYVWRGVRNYVRLDPGHRPAHILKVQTDA